MRLRGALIASACFVALLWAVKVVETLAGLDLVGLGVYPRRGETLVHVLTAPLVHGSFAHLFANSAPLLVLGTALLYVYPRAARWVLPAGYLGPGLGVWAFARDAWHIGASGLAFSLLLFVFVVGALRWEPRAIAVSMAVFFLYGGTLWGVLPGVPGVSFEAHLAGAAIGIALAFALRNADPRAPRKQYSWEQEGAAEDDDWPPG